MVDDQRNYDQPKPQPQRVISLLGAATETLYRLGLGERLVGRSHECDYPKPVLSLPCISRPRLNVSGSSREIDCTVRQRSAAGEPIYKLDDEVLATLAPFDLLIAQDHCRVCAVTPSDINQSQVLACANVKQLVLKPSTLSDVLEDVNKVAVAMGVPERGIALRATLEERMDRVRNLTKSRTKRRVALLEWCDPIMGCGYWIPELIEIAGGSAMHCPPPGGATPTISFQTLLDSKPDILVFALCGFGLTRAASEIKSSWKESWINDMMEQTSGQMYVVDGNYLINRSGPRVVESAEALAEAIHPDLQGHFGLFGSDLLTSFNSAMGMADAGLHTGSEKVRPEPFEEKPGISISNNDTIANSQQSVEGEAVPTDGAAKAVAMQLKYLEEGDINNAFALNSTANQARWCGAERFAAVLQSHSDFQRLLQEPAAMGKCEEKDGLATVIVSLLPRKQKDDDVEGKEEEQVNLLWTMIAEKESNDSGEVAVVWRTEKVGMAP